MRIDIEHYLPDTLRIGDWFIDFDIWNPIRHTQIGHSISNRYGFSFRLRLIFIEFGIYHDSDWKEYQL